MTSLFEVKYRDVAGRVGKLTIRNKQLETPLLLPVINPNYLIIPPKDMQKYLRIQAIITNAYIIKNSPLLNEILDKGLHSFFEFDGIIETDSGSYQMLHYKKEIEYSNSEIVKFQIELGSDIINVLDIPTDIDADYEQAKKELEITINRIKEGISIANELNYDGAMNGAIQGGIYKDLREESANRVAKLNVDIFAIGTIVPYMINYKFDRLLETIMAPRVILPLNKPVHLFGVGHPLLIPLLSAIGGDIFDSASYVLFAKDNRVMYHNGTFKLEILENSYISGFKEEYLAKEVKKFDNETKIKIIAEHNLKVLVSEINIVKDAIKHGYLWDIVLAKAHVHKALYKATRFLLEKYYQWLKHLDPIRKSKGIRYYGDLLELRTDIKRALERLKERSNEKDLEYLYEYIYPFNQLRNE